MCMVRMAEEVHAAFLAQLKAVLLVITTYGVIVVVCIGVGVGVGVGIGIGIGVVDKS